MTIEAWKPKSRVLASFGNEVKEQYIFYRKEFEGHAFPEDMSELMIEDDQLAAKMISNSAIEKMLRSGRL